MFNKYPYTDIHELNLDWILNKVTELDSKVDDTIERVVRERVDKLFINAMYDAENKSLILVLEERK